MSSRTRHFLRTATVTGVTLVALGPLAPPPLVTATVPTAAATAARTVEREGNCKAGPAEWDLDVERRTRRRLRIEFEIDEIRRGQRWNVFVSHNGRRVASVTRVARTSRGIRVVRFTRNRRGRDRIKAAAVHPRTGSTCVARLRF